jgi:hypothetical protein
MILYPPQSFDLNEWFLTGVMIGQLLLVWLMPKRFHLLVTVVILSFNFFLAQTVDLLIAVKPYDLYDANDGPVYEIFDFLLYAFVYPPVAYIVIYLYDKWKPTGWKLIGYVLGWSLLTFGLEGLSLLFRVFQYKGWHLYYSFFVYIGVYVLNICLYKYVKICVGKAHNTSTKKLPS